MQFLSLSHIDEVISSFPMESPEPFSYFHPFHCNIYIYYELNEFLWFLIFYFLFFILFPVFFWCDYNTTAPHICQYIFAFYFNIFYLSLSYLHWFYNIFIYLIIFRLFHFLRCSTLLPGALLYPRIAPLQSSSRNSHNFINNKDAATPNLKRG